MSHFSSHFVFLSLLCFILAQSSSALVISSKNHQHHHGTPTFEANQSTCALFAGSWVVDNTYPLYESSSCPFIDPEFNCQMYGRPDSAYLKYKWKPLNCELPRFNGREFLMRMKGKSIMFVGDSLGRNQWESIMCLIATATPQTQMKMITGDPLSTLKFLEYGVAISFYRAPYLVDIDMAQGKRILNLDKISGNANAWRDADVLVFNTGHWWTHKGSLQGWDLMESGGKYYQDMDRLVAMEKGLKTWSNWVDSNIERTKTKVFFLSTSPTHYKPSDWSVGSTTTTTTNKNCFGETAPMRGTTYPGTYPDQMRVVDSVLRDMHYPTYLLDITMLSELRKDGHPSIYSGDLNPQQRANPAHSADCSHWCLPGLPDTWNQLLYTALFH